MNVPKLRFKEFTDEWQKKTLKSVSSYFKSGKSIKSNDILKNAPYPVYGGNGLRGYTNTFNFDGNASLIGRQGALCGNVTYVKGKNYMTEHAVIVQSNYDNYNKFLFYILLSMNLNQYSTQSAQPGLSVNNLLELFNYFPNIQEQEKIAKFLTTVDKKITNLENTITSLENQKKGLLQQIFSQKLRFKDKNSNNYPNWEKKKLEDIAIFLDNKRKPLEQSERIHGKYPYYGASGIIDYINDYIFDEELVLLSEDGANIIDRNYPICYIATGKYWVNNHAHVLKVKSQYVNKFICESLEQLNYTKYNTGTAQPKLNQDVCRKIILSIPCLEEQTKIANFLSTFDRKLENQKAQLEHWKQIKKGLLQQMFV